MRRCRVIDPSLSSRLAKQFVAAEVCGKRMRFATALEQTAPDLEARAAALAETVERTQRLSVDLRDISTKANETVRPSTRNAPVASHLPRNAPRD